MTKTLNSRITTKGLRNNEKDEKIQDNQMRVSLRACAVIFCRQRVPVFKRGDRHVAFGSSQGRRRVVTPASQAHNDGLKDKRETLKQVQDDRVREKY